MTDTKALAIVPTTLDEVNKLTVQFAKSALLPQDLRGKEADIFVTMLAGQELGLPPMAALRGIHVVKGKPILSADTMVAVVLGSGLAEHFTCTAENDTSVTYQTKRRGAPGAVSCTWTMKDAERAGLGGDNWKKYPRSMLKARCKAMLARDVYPDVLAGCYEEAEAAEAGINGATAFAPIPGAAKAIDAQVVEKPAAAPSDPAPSSPPPAAAATPPAKPAKPAEAAVPQLSEDDLVEMITKIGTFTNKRDLNAFGKTVIMVANKTLEQHDRIKQAYEDQLDLIDQAAQEQRQ